MLYRFAPRVPELPVARRALREWLLGDTRRNPEAVQELLLVATELCTHAVHHARSGMVTLRAWEDDDAVLVEVEGLDSVHEPSAAVRSLDDPLEEGGRGMLIVQSLCDEVSVVVRGRSRFVRCRKQLAAASTGA